MSNPTSNFGWQMPTPTDLVTDLPADFEVFGQAVDTSLADLRGGTTGQILSKTTNADMDFTWTSANPGDITGVTAGTGISGGGTSGDVTVTNSMATAIDAKGDLIVGTGADTFSRLAAGTNTYILTADSAEATGLKWAAPSAGASFAGVSLYITANQFLTNNTDQVITFTDELYDTDAFHSTATNTGRITIPSGMGGYYQFNCSVGFNSNTTGNRRLQLFKNGAVMADYTGYEIQTAVGFQYCRFSIVINTTAADYYEMVAFQDSGTTLQTLFQGVSFQAIKVA